MSVLLNETQDEVNQHLQDFLRGLSDVGLGEVILDLLHVDHVLDADLISFVHHHKEVGEVEVVRLVHRRDTVHYFLLHSVNTTLVSTLGKHSHVEGWTSTHRSDVTLAECVVPH